MNIEVIKCHEIPYGKHLEVVFYKCYCDSYCEIVTIVAFTVCKKFFKSRTVKNLLRVSRSETFTKVLENHLTLPVLEPLMRVHNYGSIGS